LSNSPFLLMTTGMEAGKRSLVEKREVSVTEGLE
jgi:hypothetical protein